MISVVAIVIGVFFLAGVIIDLKTKQVPSVLFTSLIFIALFIAGFSYGVDFGYLHILFGIIMGVLGLLLWEMYFIGGIADVKALILMGLFCFDFANLFAMIFLIVVLGTLYQAGFKLYRYKRGEIEGENMWKAMFLSKNEEPFLLLLFIVYLIMMSIGGIM